MGLFKQREPLQYGTRVRYTRGVYRELTATVVGYNHGEYLLSIDTPGHGGNNVQWDTNLNFTVMRLKEA